VRFRPWTRASALADPEAALLLAQHHDLLAKRATHVGRGHRHLPFLQVQPRRQRGAVGGLCSGPLVKCSRPGSQIAMQPRGSIGACV
jgi:hypothetical protein